MVVHAVMVSDLITYDGQFLHKKYFNGQTHNSGRRSNYLWPELIYPPHHYWQSWHLFISQVIGYPSLLVPLGDWYALPQYSHELEFQLDMDDSTLSMMNNKCGPSSKTDLADAIQNTTTHLFQQHNFLSHSYLSMYKLKGTSLSCYAIPTDRPV